MKTEILTILKVYTLIITLLLSFVLGFCGLVVIAFKTGVYGNGDISAAIKIFLILAAVLFFGVWAFIISKKGRMVFPLVVTILYTILFTIVFVAIQSFL